MGDCFKKCVFEKLGLFDETYGLNVENIVEAEKREGFSESVARSMAKKCAVKKLDTESICEWARRSTDCVEAEEQSRNK